MPNLAAAEPTASGLRRDRRVEPEQHIERRPVLRAEPHPARHAGEHLGLLGRLDREPGRRCSVGGSSNGAPKVRIGLADSLDRDPVVGYPGTSSDRPFAA
jgi:hypothetical protein